MTIGLGTFRLVRAARAKASTIGAKSVPGLQNRWSMPCAAERVQVVFRRNAGHEIRYPWLALLMARQMRSGVAGMSICVTPSGASASSIAAMIACGAAIAPAWPEPFTPSGLAFVGTPRQRDVEVGQILGARQGVVHERAAQHLAGVRIIDRVFQHRLADTLRHAALHLPDGQHRIDQGAEVIDRGIALQGGAPVSGSTSTSAIWQPFGKVIRSSRFQT